MSDNPRPPEPMGLLMFLPYSADLGFEHGLYKHPVVIISPVSADGKVDFFPVTSLRGKDLLDKFPTDFDKRCDYLPIKPSDRNLDNDILLELHRTEDRLPKKSYIRIGKVYTAEIKRLRSWKHSFSSYREVYLSEDSFSELISYAEYSGPTPQPEILVMENDTPVSSPSKVATLAQVSPCDAPGSLINDEAPIPQAVKTNIAFPWKVSARIPLLIRQTSLLPAPCGMNIAQQHFMTGKYGWKIYASSSKRHKTKWHRTFGVPYWLLLVVVAFHWVFWALLTISELIVARWRWLKHQVSIVVDAVKDWFAKFRGTWRVTKEVL